MTMQADDIYARVPADMPAWLAGLNLQMTVDGCDADSPSRASVIHACNEQVIADYPQADIGHADGAVMAAVGAFPRWSKTDWAERRQMLEAFADRLFAERETLALIIASESGRPLRRALGEVLFSVDYVRIIAAQTLPDIKLDRQRVRATLKHRPLGVVAAIAPWNAPVILAIAKIANALLAGDTMVLRPSPFTPLSALYLGQIGRNVFPAGVFNVITGAALVGAALTTHAQVAKISFTGSTATGKLIAAAAAPTLKRVTLELGGNDAAIVLPDADIGALVDAVHATALANAGHFCAGIKRLYVHERCYDEVRDAIVSKATGVTTGSCFDPATTMTPVQNRPQFDRIWSLIDDAVANGGQLACGGVRNSQGGLFIAPTIVENIGQGCRLVDEEQFGPALPIMAFTDEDLVIEQANHGTYGLGGSVWTRDMEKGVTLADRLEVGTAWINQHGAFTAALPMPFAKESGIGMDYAEYGVAEHSRAMLVNALLPDGT